MTGTEKLTILFADVAGSTRLYETLGDEPAQRAIADCMSFLGALTERHGGVVIKTIGDAVMARFDNAGDALRCARDAQIACTSGKTFGGQTLSLYVGFHYGQAVMSGGDTYGDAVNVAARITDLARAKQILTTDETVAQLSPDCAELTRRLDRTTVRGRQTEVVFHEVVWERPADITMFSALPQDLGQAATILQLGYRDQELTLKADSAPFLLGRGDHADLVVASGLASREHCRLEHRRDKFVLTDQSTNGTFVSVGAEELYLRREELTLRGSGVISLGASLADGDDHAVNFRVLDLSDYV